MKVNIIKTLAGVIWVGLCVPSTPAVTVQIATFNALAGLDTLWDWEVEGESGDFRSLRANLAVDQSALGATRSNPPDCAIQPDLNQFG